MLSQYHQGPNHQHSLLAILKVHPQSTQQSCKQLVKRNVKNNLNDETLNKKLTTNNSFTRLSTSLILSDKFVKDSFKLQQK
jgi:hypothetical protein